MLDEEETSLCGTRFVSITLIEMNSDVIFVEGERLAFRPSRSVQFPLSFSFRRCGYFEPISNSRRLRDANDARELIKNSFNRRR